MKLILVRHGDYFEDCLTIKGVKQAEKAAEELAPIKIKAIYCSPAKRCEQTMDEILEIRNDEIEINFSDLIGPKTKKESYEKLKMRVNIFLDDIKHDYENADTVAIISHQLVTTMMILLLTGEARKLENGEMEII